MRVIRVVILTLALNEVKGEGKNLKIDPSLRPPGFVQDDARIYGER